MTTKIFRSATMTKLKAWGTANFPTTPIIYENGPVPDEDQMGPLWVDAELRWYGASPMTVGTAHTRHTGALSLSVYARTSAGTGATDNIVDSLSAEFSHTRVGGGMFTAPQRSVPIQFKGWYKTSVFVPFVLDVTG